MALTLYLAMTGEEIGENLPFPENFAWLCRDAFRQPEVLEAIPAGAVAVLTDELLPEDPAAAAEGLAGQGSEWAAAVLDFQRADAPGAAALGRALAEQLACPVVAPAWVAGSGPVLLPPVPPDTPAEAYLEPWQGREIWLEAALDGCRITVDAHGSRRLALPRWEGALPHADGALCCHYRLELGEQAAFTLGRTPADLKALLEKADSLGVTHAIGLYQELGEVVSDCPKSIALR